MIRHTTGSGRWLCKCCCCFSKGGGEEVDENVVFTTKVGDTQENEEAPNDLETAIERREDGNSEQNSGIRVTQNQLGKSEKELDFNEDPSFIKTIRTKAAKKDSKGIFGLTVLSQELFIISQHSQDVEVYDSQTLDFKRKINLTCLYDPIDIRSCSENNCLYIFDWQEERQSSEIIRFDSDGKLITKWKTEDGGGYISITTEATVLLSVWKRSLLKEFTAEGKCLRDIQLQFSVTELRLAIKMPNGGFLISQGEDEESEHSVSLVDDKGTVVKSIGGKKGSSNGEFYGPNYMVVDGFGFVLIADQNNKRVVLLSPDLEFNREVIQERDDLRYPVRMDLDRRSGRLYVADNDYLQDCTGWRDGRVMVFDIKIRQTS